MTSNITVCASGGGGNFQTLIDNQKNIGYKITLLIVDRECGAIERAFRNNIPYIKIDRNQSIDALCIAMDKVIPGNTKLIILAGFFPILNNWFCNKWKNKVINTHPSLLPKYGGKGMYGVKVQEAVMAAKEKYAGCTIHYVIPEIDGGEIILQKSIVINYNQTPWQLGGRVFKEENKLLVKAIKILIHKD